MEFAHRPKESSQSDSQTFSPSKITPALEQDAVAEAAAHDTCRQRPAIDKEVQRCRMELMANWADEPLHDPAPRDLRKSNSRRDGFDALTSGVHGQSISMQQAPSQIVLPKEMTEGMRVAWNKSLPMGSSQEQGGLLLRNRDGSLKWLASKPGDSQQITLNYDDVNPNQMLLANGHTHPYSKEELGHTRVPFSGGDLAAQVFDEEKLSIVQSGDAMFASAKTREFDALIKGRGPGGRWALSKEIEKFWRNNYREAAGDLREKAEVATRATADWYHLLYYSGKQGALQRVNTTAKNDEKIESR